MVTRSSRRDVLFACSSGGHLDQLFWLEHWWGGLDSAWATFAKPDAEDRLRGRRCYPLAYPTNRSVRNTLRNTVRALRILWRERPALIVSSGAGPAVPFFWVGKLLFRCKTVYLEPWDRVRRPTLTSKLVRPVADLGIASTPGQLAGWAKVRVVPAPFWRLVAPGAPGACEPDEAAGPQRPGRNVLVTVGTHEQPFDRLIRAVEALARARPLPEIRFACQHGVATQPHGYAEIDANFMSFSLMAELMQWADVVISPSSPGTAVLGYRHGCRLLGLPRRACHKEVVDDHQQDFFERLCEVGVAEQLSPEAFDRALAAVPKGAARAREAAWAEACERYALETGEAVRAVAPHLRPGWAAASPPQRDANPDPVVGP